MLTHKLQLADIAGLYAGCLLAVSMELLGLEEEIGRRWLISSPIIAAVVSYALLAAIGAATSPDSSGWIAIGTLVLAVGAIGGMIFAGRSAGHLARQTHVLVEAAYPYIRLVLDAPPEIPRRLDIGEAHILAWLGQLSVVAGTTPAREVNVWVRDAAGYYFARLSRLIPLQTSKFFAIESPERAAQCPFSTMRSEDFMDDHRVWLGLVWIGPDNSCRFNLYRIRTNDLWQGTEFDPDQPDADFPSAKVPATDALAAG